MSSHRCPRLQPKLHDPAQSFLPLTSFSTFWFEFQSLWHVILRRAFWNDQNKELLLLKPCCVSGSGCTGVLTGRLPVGFLTIWTMIDVNIWCLFFFHADTAGTQEGESGISPTMCKHRVSNESPVCLLCSCTDREQPCPASSGAVYTGTDWGFVACIPEVLLQKLPARSPPVAHCGTAWKCGRESHRTQIFCLHPCKPD